jgi:hypothetical protein
MSTPCQLLLLGLLLFGELAGAKPAGHPVGHPPPGPRVVTVVTYQGQPLWLKRTPVAKRPRAGRQAIGELEAQLAACFRSLPTSDTAQFLRPAQRDSLLRALQVVREHYPRWSLVAYNQEERVYRRIQAQRQLQRLVRQFTQAQHQLDSLGTRTQRWAATATFAHAAHAGQAAEQAQQWVQAEVCLARCLVLRPTDAALRLRHVKASEQCQWRYFTRFVRASQRIPDPDRVSQTETRLLQQEPVYRAAAPRIADYLTSVGADYAALALGSQPAYLYQLVELYTVAQELLPDGQAGGYMSRAIETLQAYRQACGADNAWRAARGLLGETQQRRRSY